MNITDCFKVRKFVLTAALSAGLSFVSPAFGQQQQISYIVDSNSGGLTQLGTLGGFNTSAQAINDAGQVAGSSDTATEGISHAFITGPNGVGMTDLGTLSARVDSFAEDINDAGQVVGESSVLGGGSALFRHAFITGPNGMGMTDLGALGGESSVGNGINAAGQVVGTNTTTFNYRAFITGPNGVGMTDLGALGGEFSSAKGINDAGQVVGEFTEGATHAFITGPNGVGMTDLGALAGGYSSATSINDSGQVVGESSIDEEFTLHAFITGPNGVGMTDLGTLGGSQSYAYGINDAGQVVGASDTAEGGIHAFITGPNGEGMTDLNSLVSLPAGVVLSAAVGINSLGQVVVVGTIPEPATYALMLAGLGLVGFMARRRESAK